MRMLSDHELDLVAGGWGSSDWWGEAEIWGYSLFFSWQDLLWMSEPVPGEGGGSGGAAEPVQEPNATPCVETVFDTGVSTTDANRAALAAGNAIMARNFQTYEYSAIVWTYNGEVGYTDPYTDHLTGEVNLLGAISAVPDGAVIIGIVHNHPDDPIINDSYPSGAGSDPGGDWDAYDAIVGHTGLPRGITVDSNMLLWMVNAEDNKIRVYDKTDKNQTQASCSIN
jgi:hypothetical protein